jgi:hypothetical protein
MKSFALLLLTLCLGFTSHSYAQELAPVVPRAKRKAVKKEMKEAPAFLIGVEARQYRYSEPGYVEHAGLLYGIWGEWNWTSAIGDGKVYGDVVFGSITYNGSACSTQTGNCVPLQAPTTDIIGRLNSRLEYYLNYNFDVFGGVGYRYLFDRGEGGSFYDRTGQWLFLPVGAGFNFSTGWGRGFFELEYDWLLMGTFDSKLSQAVSTAPDLHHEQNSGFGVIVATGLEFAENYKLQAFFELWKLDKTAAIQTYTEPDNNSESYGLKLGYKF